MLIGASLFLLGKKTAAVINQRTGNCGLLIGSDIKSAGFCFRITTIDLDIHIHFFGFYKTASTTSEVLLKIVNDVFIRFQLSIQNCRGQCYDGAAKVSGHISGLRQLLSQGENRAFLYIVEHIN